jgi:hypothetical protein
MPRRPAIDPPTRLELQLPESERAWLDLHLWSEVENRVPFGAHRAWFLARLQEYRAWLVLDLAPHGFPPGMYVKGPEEVIRRLEARLTEKELT